MIIYLKRRNAMKVLFVTNQYPSERYPYKGSFIYTQASEIKKHLDDLIVLAPNYGKESNYQITNGIKVYRFQTFTKPTSDPLLRELFKGLSGLFSLLFFIIFQTISIIKITKKEEIDLLHAHWILPSGFSSYLASIVTGKKLVITTNGSDLTYCGKNKFLRKFVCFVLSRISKLICVSNNLNIIAKQICSNNFSSQTILIGVPNYISKKTGQLSNLDEKGIKSKFQLIFIGSLYPIKGIKYLLESISILSSKRQDFILNIIGGGDALSIYDKYVTDNNLEEFIIFHGFKPHDVALNFLRQADVAIQASLSEGQSVFIQESVYLGKAIIATDVGGTNEIVIDDYNGILIKPKKSQLIAEKIDLLLSNPQKIVQFSKNSLIIAKKKLMLENNMASVVDIYRHVLKTN
ncbi:MAG: glycosyltransferase family 4 protein [Asgard group archaeon]|nr:glycosyltransferase family 4 protein [Asgard group archaeon]